MKIERRLRPRVWHLVLLGVALLSVHLAMEWLFVRSTRESTLRMTDTAMVALRAELAALGPIRREDGALYAGETRLEDGVVVDRLREATGLGATVSAGHLRAATTLRREDDGIRAVGTAVSPELTRQVLEGGEVFRGRAQSLGQDRMIRVERLTDAGGHPVGMLATWVDWDEFHDGVVAFRVVIGATLVILFAAIGSLWFAAGRFTADLQAQSDAIEERNVRLEAATGLLRRRAEELENARLEAEAARDEAQRANRAKSLFLANMSHELRTPLNAIIGYGELLIEDAADADRDDLERIVRASRHLLAVISDILDVAKIEAGRLELDLEWFPLADLLADVIAQSEPLAAARHNRLVLEASQAPDLVRADPTRLRQILLNLLSNAAKFTEQGDIALWVRADGDRVRFEVHDTGIGMEPGQLDRVFDAFVQADPTHTRRYGGTGLGLTIVRHLVDHLGGSVEVRSAPGVGTTFVVSLPREVRIRTTSGSPAGVPRSEAGPPRGG